MKWNQVESSGTKWNKVESSGTNWNKAERSESPAQRPTRRPNRSQTNLFWTPSTRPRHHDHPIFADSMNKPMTAVGVSQKRREVRLVEQTAPLISADDEVKVRSLEVGICGTDKEICTFVYGAPPQGFEHLIIGHESLGQVVEVGKNVCGLKPGDLVVPSVRRPCPHEHCQPCRAGLQDFCATGDFTERGIKMRHGYMTEYYVDKEQFLNFVPPNLRDVAVLVEPLTVAEKGIAQALTTQKRLPWIKADAPPDQPGKGLNAVVLGAGPIGILGAMMLKANGFTTYVYSRSQKPNPKADLVESFGVEYISSEIESAEQLAKRVGNIDLIYEGIGVSKVSFDVMRVLGQNGVFIFTGIPAPKPAIPVMADEIMRNIVLKNQAIIGTVNADRAAFQNAIRDLGIFMERWPEAIKSVITGRYTIDSYRDLLIGDKDRMAIKSVITFAK
jgi:threonine dehydrogenase-like Zn-dependent dehydrogenase